MSEAVRYGQTRTWAEISIDQFAENYRILSGVVGKESKIMTIVKADAYGHGAVEIAKELQTIGSQFLGVSTIQEAIELRENSIQTPILILSVTYPEDIPIIINYKIVISVFDFNSSKLLSDAAVKTGKRVSVHLKVDTGLSRFGIPIKREMENAISDAIKIASLPGINLCGVFTHFAVGGDSTQDDFTLSQINTFLKFTKSLSEKGLNLLKHCANSPVSLRFPQARLDMVRLGTLSYGFNPFGYDINLKEVMSLKSRIIYLKDLEPGETISYGRMYEVKRKSRIAVIPFGVADGVHRSCSNRAQMLLHGKRVNVVGKICMDNCFLDVTEIPEVKIGDTVTIFGQDNNSFLSIYEYTNLYPGSAPELSCMLGKRIPKYYLKKGQVIAIT